jgi:archaellin
MKFSTNHGRKIPKMIRRLLRSDPGAVTRIARSVRRADGSRGVDHSLVSRVLSGEKRSARVEYTIIRYARKLAKQRAFDELAKAEALGRQL